MVPDYESFMLPLLELLADGQERTTAECRESLATRFELAPEDMALRIASGATLLGSRVHWAATYLAKAGAVHRPRRGSVQITAVGRALLAEAPTRLDTAFLVGRFEDVRNWLGRAPGRGGAPGESKPSDRPELSPEEALNGSYLQLKETVVAELLAQARGVQPLKFELLVLDLLLKLGYAGAFGEGIHMGRTGDGGVDGVIRRDKLGLELIYIQAKRWQGNVSASTVREFAGSLAAHRANKGVIITTSTFTDDARREADRMSDRIALVDGQQLASLMYEVGLGATVTSTLEIKRLDSDYFESPE